MQHAVKAMMITLLALSVSAVTLDVPRLSTPAFADRETAGDTAIPANPLDNLRHFHLGLTFDATPSNNVQIAFGQDADPLDGKLAAEETSFIIGWDSGAWFLRPAGLKDRYVYSPANSQSAQRCTLRATIRVNTQGTPTAVEFNDDAGNFAFDGFSHESPPAWLTPKAWDLLRVTVRGADVAAENVKARFLPDGAIIILR